MLTLSMVSVVDSVILVILIRTGFRAPGCEDIVEVSRIFGNLNVFMEIEAHISISMVRRIVG